MKIKLSIFALSVLFALNSCKKTTKTVDKDVSVASDNSLGDAIYNDVQNISDQAAKGQLVFYMPISDVDQKEQIKNLEYNAKTSCATITHDSVSTPKTLTIDFGNTNCLCNDGKYRKGQINVSYTGKYRDPGSVHTISFTNYFVNDNQVLGTKTVTNNGVNGNGNLTFSIVVDGTIKKASNGGTIIWKSNRTREWLAGATTQTWYDDVYSITGSGSGISAKGVSYTTTITTPLHRALNCHWFDSGVIEVNPANLPVRVIDYGSGSCDNNINVTINGVTYPITIN
jgi:hypothetical protein